MADHDGFAGGGRPVEDGRTTVIDIVADPEHLARLDTRFLTHA